MSASLFSVDENAICNTNVLPSTLPFPLPSPLSFPRGRKQFRRERSLNHTKDDWLQLKNVPKKKWYAVPSPAHFLMGSCLRIFPYYYKEWLQIEPTL